MKEEGKRREVMISPYARREKKKASDGPGLGESIRRGREERGRREIGELSRRREDEDMESEGRGRKPKNKEKVKQKMEKKAKGKARRREQSEERMDESQSEEEKDPHSEEEMMEKKQEEEPEDTEADEEPSPPAKASKKPEPPQTASVDHPTTREGTVIDRKRSVHSSTPASTTPLHPPPVKSAAIFAPIPTSSLPTQTSLARSALRARSAQTTRKHVSSALSRNNSSGRFSAREEDMPDEDELEKIKFTVPAGFSFGVTAFAAPATMGEKDKDTPVVVKQPVPLAGPSSGLTLAERLQAEKASIPANAPKPSAFSFAPPTAVASTSAPPPAAFSFSSPTSSMTPTTTSSTTAAAPPSFFGSSIAKLDSAPTTTPPTSAVNSQFSFGAPAAPSSSGSTAGASKPSPFGFSAPSTAASTAALTSGAQKPSPFGGMSPFGGVGTNSTKPAETGAAPKVSSLGPEATPAAIEKKVDEKKDEEKKTGTFSFSAPAPAKNDTVSRSFMCEKLSAH